VYRSRKLDELDKISRVNIGKVLWNVSLSVLKAGMDLSIGLNEKLHNCRKVKTLYKNHFRVKSIKGPFRWYAFFTESDQSRNF